MSWFTWEVWEIFSNCFTTSLELTYVWNSARPKHTYTQTHFPPHATKREARNTGHPAIALIGQQNNASSDDSPPMIQCHCEWCIRRRCRHTYVKCVYVCVCDWYSLRLCGCISLWNTGFPWREHLWGSASGSRIPVAQQPIWSFTFSQKDTYLFVNERVHISHEGNWQWFTLE